ncbi:MAG: MAPEG family protein [Myxococcota bacterium]
MSDYFISDPSVGDFALVYPMFAMVLLTFLVLIKLFRTRVSLARSGEVDPSYYKTYQGGSEPEKAIQLQRHFANIFESPSLFYVACLAALIIAPATVLIQSLAWLYVGLRAAHALVHIGSNDLRLRIPIYFGSWLVLLLMWLYVAVAAFTLRAEFG